MRVEVGEDLRRDKPKPGDDYKTDRSTDRMGQDQTIKTPKISAAAEISRWGCFVAAAAAFASRGLKTLGSWPGPFFIPECAEASVGFGARPFLHT